MKIGNDKNNSKHSVTHIGLRHRVEDSRVFYRECVSLTNNYNVSLICSGDKTTEFVKDGVTVIQIRKKFFPFYILHAFFKSISYPSEVCHAHDIEGLIVSFMKKALFWKMQVVFDVHEYYEDYAFDKNKKLNKRGKVFNKIYTLFLKPLLPKLCEGIIVINPIMKEYYSSFNQKVEVIYNYPKSFLLDEIEPNNLLDSQYDYLLYHGGIKEDRGILLYPQLLHALKNEKVRLLIIGGFPFKDLRSEFDTICKELNIEDRVILTGQLPFKETISYLKNNVRFIGLTMFTYQEDHKKAINMKIFEYLYLAIPQVGSDYRIYFKKYILDNNAGIGADFHDMTSQVTAVDEIFSNYSKYKNTCFEIRDKYIWETEEKKLFEFYKNL